MKLIHINDIINYVKKMCIDANCSVSNDIKQALINGKKQETSSFSKEILNDILLNADIAENNKVPLCQDTGMAVFFVDIGQNVKIEGGYITDAINKGVELGYKEGYLRKSVVSDPIIRLNTDNNTPAIIHYNITNDNYLRIRFMAKGFGSENMSSVKMLKPSDGIEGIKQFVLDTVQNAGPNTCPPIIVGVGIGGTIEKACMMAKYALSRNLNEKNSKEHIRRLEEELLISINKLGIGPQGLGGLTTCLGVNIEVYATHIAGLPVAVNLNCHASRHMEVIL